MKRTQEKSAQPVTSPKPTTLNLQTRAFAPTSSDSSQVNRKSEDTLEQSSTSSSENLLEKLISSSSDSADRPIQRKSLHRFPIQAKLNIGEPNDKYEKEADATASKVVQQINSSTQDLSVQRQDSTDQDEIQMKPVISKIQREESMENEDEELQMKSLVQKRENVGGGEASNDLESSIQNARGSGQSLDPNLQEKMGQAMGADFSGVKVHIDSHADQLNKSIQAKAFTTGQDVFFRQGAYEPSSKSGQELIAHELTHVVQQNGQSVYCKAAASEQEDNIEQSQMQSFQPNFTQRLSIQRETKNTEKKAIASAGNNDNLTDNKREALLSKLKNNDQSSSAARKIAAEIELESEQLVSQIANPVDQQRVRKAIKDYVTSSTAIQTDARKNPAVLSQAVTDLDFALNTIRAQMAGGEKRRITYRSITYDNGVNDIPYGLNVNGNIINVNDFVGDLGFQSSSEHRQFVLGKTQTNVPPALVKQVIYSFSGVPIALDFPIVAYSNSNEKLLYDNANNSKKGLEKAWHKAFSGPQAGQAEILFGRDTVFKVTKIDRQDNDDYVAVVLEEHRGPRPPVVKAAKFGKPI
ncbi:MAG: DUF4157 domain-containing protein [Pseudanabaena sp.]